MTQKVLIIRSTNFTPEEEVNERLEALGSGWKIVSIDTRFQPFGEVRDAEGTIQPWHVFFVTTVVVESGS